MTTISVYLNILCMRVYAETHMIYVCKAASNEDNGSLSSEVSYASVASVVWRVRHSLMVVASRNESISANAEFSQLRHMETVLAPIHLLWAGLG